MILTSSGSTKLKFSIVLAFFGIFATSSCVRSKGTLREDGYFETRDTRYKIGPVPHSWKRVSLRKGDLAYVNTENGATLFINSSCDKDKDTPLLALSWHLLIGMTETKILDRKIIPHSQREGMETTVLAKLDGVQRKLRTFVLKKNYCVYDIVYSASPDSFEENLNVYQAALESLYVPGQKL